MDYFISQHGDTLWTRKKVEKLMCCIQTLPQVQEPNFHLHDVENIHNDGFTKHFLEYIIVLLCFFFFHQIRLLLVNKYIKIRNKIKHRFSILIRILNHLVIIRRHITKDSKINENPKYYRVHLIPTPTLTPFQCLKHKT